MVIEPIYLPFTVEELCEHFVVTERTTQDDVNRWVEYYTASARRYAAFLDKLGAQSRNGISIKEQRYTCQIEKDERFWTAACLLGLYHNGDRTVNFSHMMKAAFPKTEPPEGCSNWEDCFEGDLRLYLEVGLPSPKAYNEWLRQNITQQNLVPYIQHAAMNKNGQPRKNPEGTTYLDALLLNQSNGVAVLFEAKVMSDVSHSITFDMTRNQLARGIDVMLEDNPQLPPPLKSRKPEHSFFILLTPEMLREKPRTRLYSSLMNDYRNDPSALTSDLAHRSDVKDWGAVSRRIGWLTWEDCEEIQSGCCQWL